MATNVTYNSFDLQDTNFITHGIDRYSIPTRNNQSMRLSFRDNSKVVSSFWENKIIEITGNLVTNVNENTLQNLMSGAKTALAVPEQTLTISYVSLDIDYTATCIKADFPRANYNVLFVPYIIQFQITDPPYGVESTTNTVTDNGMTAATETGSFIVSGELPPRPIIQFDVNSETDLTIIEFEQTDTGDTISIEPSGGYSAGDVVIINTNTNTVTYNGSEEDYSGIFPEFQLGTNNYSIDFTSTAHNVDMTLTYSRLYL